MHIHPFIEEVLITHEQIVSKSKELGAQISKEYQGKRLVLLGLLKGCIPFLAELIKHIEIDVELDFLDVSSYHGGTGSTGQIIIKKDISLDILGADVLIVEDIVDTGLTLKEVMDILKRRKPNSIDTVTLLDKPEGRTVSHILPKYIGYTIPKKFVVGFGLDYNELYRNLPYIGVLKKSVYEK